MPEDQQERLNGDLGEEAQEAAWRELIRASVEMAFDSTRVIGGPDVHVSFDMISYGR
jgi:hypothetical protein